MRLLLLAGIQRLKMRKKKIASLNARIKKYAYQHKIPYVDYYGKMVYGENGALNPKYTKDGVHPTAEGYIVMETLIKEAIDKVL